MIRRKANGHDDLGIEVERPLPHRPNLVIIKLADGRKRVFGDSLPLSREEQLAVFGVGEQPSRKLEFSEDEQRALDDADALFERAEAAWTSLRAERDRLLDERDAVTGNADAYGGQLSPKDAQTAQRLNAEAKSLQGRIKEAEDLLKAARIERNRIKEPVMRTARARQFPDECAPAPKTLGDRLAELECERPEKRK